jgi:MFS superfamily sulfate permease-like transporter
MISVWSGSGGPAARARVRIGSIELAGRTAFRLNAENGLYAFRDLRDALEARGVTLIIAGRKTEFLIWLQEIDLYRPDHEQRFFPTLRQAMKAYVREARRSELPPQD